MHIKNYRVTSGEDPTYVLKYYEQAAIQMYAQPIADGNLNYSVGNDPIVQEKEFFIAVTHKVLDAAKLDMPLIVARVDLD